MKRSDDATEQDTGGSPPPGDEPGQTPPPREKGESKGAGPKHGVQRKPEDQKGRPDPQEME